MDEIIAREQERKVIQALHGSHYRVDKAFLLALYDALATAYGHGITKGLTLAFHREPDQKIEVK